MYQYVCFYVSVPVSVRPCVCDFLTFRAPRPGPNGQRIHKVPQCHKTGGGLMSRECQVFHSLTSVLQGSGNSQRVCDVERCRLIGVCGHFVLGDVVVLGHCLVSGTSIMRALLWLLLTILMLLVHCMSLSLSAHFYCLSKILFWWKRIIAQTPPSPPPWDPPPASPISLIQH